MTLAPAARACARQGVGARAVGRILLALLLAGPAASGAARAAVEVRGSLEQWHTVELVFDGPSFSETASDPNPFLDYRMQVEFTNGSTTRVVPGFFAADGEAADTSADAGSKWIVRFTPGKTGTWNWTASFRQGNDVAVSTADGAGSSAGAFDGATGSFDVTDSAQSASDLRWRGRAEYVGKHQTRFADSGQYYLKGGTDSPENFLGYYEFDNTRDTGGDSVPTVDGLHHYDPHAGDYSSADASDYTWAGGKGTNILGAIRYLFTQEANSIYMLTYNVDGGDGQDVWPWTTPDDKYHFDVSKLDQWERVFSYMDKKGMHVYLVLQERENDGVLGDENSVERRLYFRELVARFSHHLNLSWNLGEENNNTDSEVRGFAEYIRAIDPYDHPIGFHIWDDDLDRWEAFYGNTDFEFASIQSSRARLNNDHTTEVVQKSAAAGRPWLAWVDESNRDGVLADRTLARKRTLWGNLLGGGAGVEWYAGADSDEDRELEDFSEFQPLWDEMRYALDFFHSHVPFWEMSPDESLSSANYVLAKPGQIYVLYDRDGGSHDLDLSGVSGTFSVRWFDPRNGGTLQQSDVTEVSGGGVRSIGGPPSSTSSDWAILVERTDGSGNTAPTVTIDQPVDGATFTSPADLGVVASASDSDGTVQGVDLFLDGTFVRTENSAAYEWGTASSGSSDSALLDLEPGDYALEAVATDDEGATASDAITVSVQSDSDTSPDVAFTQPTSGASFTEPADVGVVVDASDTDGTVEGVDLFLDGTFVRTENNAPYEWGTANSGQTDAVLQDLPAGDYTLEAVATDDQGLTTRATRTLSVASRSTGNAPPSVAFSRPADGATFAEPAELGVVADATDSDGSITGVDLLLDGNFVRTENNAPYEWGTASSTSDPALRDLAAGEYTLELVATDDDGAATRASITVTVTDGASATADPTVSITEPSDTSLSGPADIGVVAEASADDGEIVDVELRLDGEPVRTENTAPYEWGAANPEQSDSALMDLPAGSYTIEVVATDSTGSQATDSQSFTVSAVSGDERSGGGSGGEDEGGGGSLGLFAGLLLWLGWLGAVRRTSAAQ